MRFGVVSVISRKMVMKKTDPCGILANLVYGEESDGLTII